MKVKEGFNMDLCLEVLQKHFPDCDVKKRSNFSGEWIDLKKSLFVGSRIIYRKKKGKLNIGGPVTILTGLFGILGGIPSQGIVSEVKKILGSEFGSDN